ncbi:hypothetical protein HZC08_01650 [Candidatus Micrarchaeota archaeon]|nr:hypothetical protein [Candidatus Micrarchaeota archaeon]
MDQFSTRFLSRLGRTRTVYCCKAPDGKPAKPLSKALLGSPLFLERVIRIVPPTDLPTKPPALNPGSRWKTVDALGMLGHLHIHIQPHVIASSGVPIYDLEVLKHRRFSITGLLDLIYSNLRFSAAGSEAQTAVYLTYLVRTLLYIQELGLSKVNWERVGNRLSNPRDIDFDPSRDSTDGTFFITVAVV